MVLPHFSRHWKHQIIEIKGSTIFLITVAGFLFFLSLSADIDDFRIHKMEDPWRLFSNNRFSYNICKIPHTKRREISLSMALPLAHIAMEIPQKPIKERHCHLPQGGYTSWKKGLVTSLLPDRVPWMCNKLFLGKDLKEKEKKWVDETNSMWTANISDLLQKTKSCSWVEKQFTNKFYITDKEWDFPVAYAMNIDRFPHQVLRFLKVIYRPHNIYCLHFDYKSSHEFKHIFFNIASCIKNVIIPRKIEDVYRGWYTLVDAHMSCFSDLVLARDRYPWKYVITLCGKEIPMRTNAEIVSILEPLHGVSAVQTVGHDGQDEYKFKWKWYLNKMDGWISKKSERLPPIPHNLKVYKSWAFLSLSYSFVEYILCDKMALEMREYIKDISIPEENIYPMLFMQKGVPGGYDPQYKDKLFNVMSCIWLNYNISVALRLKFSHLRSCYGTTVHAICIISYRDLYQLPYKPGVVGYTDAATMLETAGEIQYYTGQDKGPLFHNKYIMDQDHVVMDCMERELVRRNRIEYEEECLRPISIG